MTTKLKRYWITNKQSCIITLLLLIPFIIDGPIIMLYGAFLLSDNISLLGFIISLLWVPFIITKEVITREYGNGYVEQSYPCMNGLITIQSIWDGGLVPQNKTIWNQLQKEGKIPQ